MENAKQSAQIRQIQVRNTQQDARLDAVEGDIGRLADHAWQNLSNCGVGSGSQGTGHKITWTPNGGGSWGCALETDPTVKSFAKENLPSCAAGQMLRTDGNSLLCTSSTGALGFEVDPSVQDFARNSEYTIHTCAANQVLTLTNKRLICVDTLSLSIEEADPTVQAFAKLPLPLCSAGHVLTSAANASGTSVLRCVADSDGGYAELDPSVRTFAKTDLPTCAAGRVLTSNGTSLSCALAGTSTGGTHNQVQFNQNGSLAGHSGFTYNGAGALTVAQSVSAVAYYHTSDRALKTNITPIQDPMSLLTALTGSHFNWRDSGVGAYGVMAQDVEKVMPEAVARNSQGHLTVEYDQLLAPLIEAVKLQQQHIEALQQQNNELQARVDALGK